MNSLKLLPLIHNICNSNYTVGELTEFINIAQKISVSYLKYLEANGRNIRPRKGEGVNELEDVAIDCIAGLFKRNEQGEFVQLTRYFNSTVFTSIPPAESHLASMLRRLIVKKTKQELSRIFKERDPEGAKIIRNIKVAIRNSQKYSSFKEMGREFVYPENENTNEQNPSDNEASSELTDIKLTAIPERILFQNFLDMYLPSDSVSTMLEKMMQIVISSPEYNNYLGIDLIASIIREVTFQQVRDQLTNDVDKSSPINDIQAKEIEQVNQRVIQSIQEKINSQYLSKNKISQGKADIYYRAISDYVYELTQDKATDSNFQYLKRYIPDLSQITYRQDERSIFEYLVKLTKKSLRIKLKELL